MLRLPKEEAITASEQPTWPQRQQIGVMAQSLPQELMAAQSLPQELLRR